MSFVSAFIIDPIKNRSLALAKFRWMQLLHERTNGGFDRFYQKWCALVRPPVAMPVPRRLNKTGVSEVVNELQVQGCKVLPFALSGDEIEALRRFAFSTPAYSKKISEQMLIDPEKIPTEHGRYYWPMHLLVKSHVVRDLLSDSTFASIAQSYLGAEPMLAHVTLWLDPVYEGYYDPHVYHYDNDGPGFIKFFFYLTDVTTDTGAHRFIRGTHPHRKPGVFRVSKRYEDEELLNFFGEDKEVVFTAPAGTVIAEDTAGFHRGSDLKSGYRLLMQFQFSLIDIPHDEDLAGVTKPVEFAGLDRSIARVARKFYK